MGKYDKVISNARVLISDVHIKSANYGSNECQLKLDSFMGSLQRGIDILEAEEAAKNKSLLGKLKGVMFVNDNEDELDEIAADLTELIYRIKNCLKCKCSGCVNISGECGCSGCLYGSYVVDCDNEVEHRNVDNGVCEYDGCEVQRTSYDRRTKKLTITMLDKNDIERTAVFDPDK